MPKIQNVPTPVTARSTATSQAAPKKQAGATQEAQVNRGWTAATGSVGTSKAPRYPEVASTAKGFVDAYAKGSKAMSQMEMVASSVETNKAADKLLEHVAGELASQYEDRGNSKASEKVLKDLDAFMKKAGPTKGYYVDPDRGSMAALEDNGERMDKVMGEVARLTAQLGKVNADPAEENQQAFNRHAGGNLVKAEADFALAFQKKYNDSGADDGVIKKAQTFFKALPKNVDQQVESRGGSLEPLERAGGAATILNDFVKERLG